MYSSPQCKPINNIVFPLTKDCFPCHLMEGGKDSCHDVRYIKRFLKSTVTSVRLTCRASLISSHHLPQVSTLSCQIQLFQILFAYSSHLFMVYWAGHFPCLLEQLLQRWPPPFFLTGVGRLLVCRSLSSSPLLAKPAGDLMHSLYWDHMNNLFFEFSPSLTFRCLMPTGFGFNNIDSAPFLCASSDKVWKHS